MHPFSLAKRKKSSPIFCRNFSFLNSLGFPRFAELIPNICYVDAREEIKELQQGVAKVNNYEGIAVVELEQKWLDCLMYLCLTMRC